MEHKRNPDKDYWTEAVVFTTSNNSFGPTEISYLENKFCNLAIEANRYIVKNGNDPSPGHITEEKESELEELVDYAKLTMGTLGHKIFVPLNKSIPAIEDTSDTASEEIELFFTRTIKKLNFTVEASAKQTTEGFVVLKGSKIAPSSGTDDTISPGNRKKREELTALYSDLDAELNRLSGHVSIKGKIQEVDTILSHINEDMLMIPKYVAVQVYLLNYSGRYDDAANVINTYKYQIEGKAKSKVYNDRFSAVELIHEMYPYSENNRDFWLDMPAKATKALEPLKDMIEQKGSDIILIEESNDEYIEDNTEDYNDE